MKHAFVETKARQCLLLISILFAFSACQDPIEEPAVPVNPKLEMNPPIAKRILLQKAEGNQEEVLFIAEIDREVFPDTFISVQVLNDTLTLRDDGQKGDAKPFDGLFSVTVKENVGRLQERLATLNDNLANTREIIQFVNRAAVVKDRKDNEEEFRIDLDRFNRGDLTFIPDIVFKPFSTIQDLKDHSLMITDVDVVEDPVRTFNPCTGAGNPNGPWTFGEIMRQLASPSPGSIATDAQVSTFVLNWLNLWDSDQTKNGELVPARPSINNVIITPWLDASQTAGSPAGQLDMSLAPFKLLAIVNRLDLRGNSGYGFSDAGEGRFVFCALNPSCAPLQFNVIFEYGINKKTCKDVKRFAEQWYNLKNLNFSNPVFRDSLQDITDQFTLSGTNPTKPNESSLNQLRSNEIALGSPWQLREFVLNNAGNLDMTTVKQEPALDYNAKVANANVDRLANYVNTNSLAICNNAYTVPNSFSGSDFLGARSETSFPPTGNPTPVHDNNPHHWDGSAPGTSGAITDDCARHVFSLNTCSGCHGGETQTFFTHIDPAPFGTEASISGFLSGLGPDADAGDNDADPSGLFFVRDAAFRPAGSPTIRGFNDLERRALDLEDLVNQNCFIIEDPVIVFELARVFTFDPIRMTH